MKLYGITVVYNVEDLIPYVMPYVCRLGYDKWVVYDHNSTDKTVELLSKYDFIEIRKFPEDDTLTCDNFQEKRLHLVLGFFKELSAEANKTGERTFMTVTDFDEVIYFSNHNHSFKQNIEWYYRCDGYNCYAGRMINLLPPKPDLDLREYIGENTLVHTLNGIRGRIWEFEGKKPLLFLVNDKAFYGICNGNHYVAFSTVKNIPLKNLDDLGIIYSFHLRYINRKMYIERQKEYDKRKISFGSSEQDSTDIYDNSIFGSSFPLDMYFCLKQFNAISGKMEGIIKYDTGEKIF